MDHYGSALAIIIIMVLFSKKQLYVHNVRKSVQELVVWGSGWWAIGLWLLPLLNSKPEVGVGGGYIRAKLENGLITATRLLGWRL